MQILAFQSQAIILTSPKVVVCVDIFEHKMCALVVPKKSKDFGLFYSSRDKKATALLKIPTLD